VCRFGFNGFQHDKGINDLRIAIYESKQCRQNAKTFKMIVVIHPGMRSNRKMVFVTGIVFNLLIFVAFANLTEGWTPENAAF